MFVGVCVCVCVCECEFALGEWQIVKKKKATMDNRTASKFGCKQLYTFVSPFGRVCVCVCVFGFLRE